MSSRFDRLDEIGVVRRRRRRPWRQRQLLAGAALRQSMGTPLAPVFWNGRVNDLAFERPSQGPQGKTLATIRLWHTSFRVEQDRIFVGVAREYTGIRWGILHTVAPDVDAAAERFVESLQALGQQPVACRQPLVPPMVGTYLMGEHFFTLGQVWLLDISAAPNAVRLCEKGATLPR